MLKITSVASIPTLRPVHFIMKYVMKMPTMKPKSTKAIMMTSPVRMLASVVTPKLTGTAPALGIAASMTASPAALEAAAGAIGAEDVEDDDGLCFM